MHDFIRYSEIDENKILPCPFCGGRAVLIKTYCKDTKYIGYHIFHALELFRDHRIIVIDVARN